MIIDKNRLHFDGDSGQWYDDMDNESIVDGPVTIKGIWRYDSERKVYYIQTRGKQKIFLEVKKEKIMSPVWKEKKA
ncbi:MAG: hypothetical protein ABRQ38_05700 [Candidatus Eremiobacterota bacterium]